MGIAFGISALTLLLWDCYIAFLVINWTEWWWKLLVFVPAIILIAEIFYAFAIKGISQKTINLTIWLTLLIFFPTYIFGIISVLGFLLSFANPSLFGIFNWIGVGLSGVWIIGTLYGIIFGWRKITVERLELSFPNLPSNFDGYKIVQLSDFHIGTYQSSPESVKEIVNKVNSLKPDLIVFTGDLVNTSSSEIIPFLNDLKDLKAKDGVISVLGNHDYCLYRKYEYPDSPEKELCRLMDYEKLAGWKLLNNESITIEKDGEKIAIIGVENAGGKSFTDRSDLKKALKGISENEFKVLLSHDPSHWRREVIPDTNIDLTLSGHTHGMQFKIGGFSPSKWAYKEWGGMYKEKGRKLVVSTGTGGNVAFRFGVYPQILEIILKRKNI